MKRTQHGFTLIELTITLAIVVILTTIAIVLYSTQIRKGRRVDAVNSLLAMSLAEERYRSTNTSYGTLAQVWNNVSTTSEGYYTLSISNISGTSYTITATAVGDQANDAVSGTACTPLQISMSNGTVTKTPSACWPT